MGLKTVPLTNSPHPHQFHPYLLVFYFQMHRKITQDAPGVDDDYSRAKKKPCLDDRDTNPPLDKDRDTMPGLEDC